MNKKMLFAVLLIHLCLITSAQIRYGIKAGYTSATVKAIKGGAEDYSSTSGMQFGITGNGPISGKFSFLSAVLYTQKGYMEMNGAPGSLGNSSFNRTINYLELPADLLWRKKINNSPSFFLGTGLVPGFGISDKLNYIINFSGLPPDSGTTHVGFGKDKYYKFFDLGWNFLGGIEFKKVALTAEYNSGLTSLTHGGYGQTLLKNRTLSISVSYYLITKGPG